MESGGGNIHFIPGGGGTIPAYMYFVAHRGTHLCLLLFSFLSTDCDGVINLNSYPVASCTSAVIHSIHRVCILAKFSCVLLKLIQPSKI